MTNEKKEIAAARDRWSFLVKGVKALIFTLKTRQLPTHIMELSSKAVAAETTFLVVMIKKRGGLRQEIAPGKSRLMDDVTIVVLKVFQ